MSLEEARNRASRYGEVVGLISRVTPISHGKDNNEIRAEIPYEVYLKRKFLIGSYVGISIPVSGTLMLGRITSVERADILAISRIPALSPVEDTSAITTPLSLTIELLSEKVEGEVVPPSSPVDPQSPIFVPNTEFIKEMLGLPPDGITVGKLVEGYKLLDVPVNLTGEALRHHVLVVGTTGAGKTNLLRLLITRSNIPVLAFDIQGDYVRTMATIGGTVLVPVTREMGRVTDFISLFLRRSNLQDYKIASVDGQRVTLTNGERTFYVELMGFRLRETYREIPDVSPIFSGQGAYFFKMIAENCLTEIDNWIEECNPLFSEFHVHQTTAENIRRSVIMLQETGILDIPLEGGYLGEPDYEDLVRRKAIVDLRWVMEKGVSTATTTAFLVVDRIFRLIDSRYKNEGVETPYLLVFDEAHEYFPQSRRDEEKEGLERLINRILRLGRVRGIGAVLATHRPTDLNDLILTLTNTKIAMRADEDALEKIGMEEYAKILQASPPGYAVMRTFSLKVQDLVFRTDKYQ
ncbi:DNA double-strand break repair helicase HerA [Metallosphaera sp. J1]|uniref:ATP-binding protein n=1 Tax=Metallosphaera TaxID=41980 RepID=UPI001EE0B57B|nr:ATP-binding protein [Metallosphaera javensis (ex Hofmann et al. 2022)]MCG3109491.1 DNA double-strand break repair helicase HerA [Metallosphaera javensis (ex Hofmann et al. 2022)]BCS93461.1 MAG: DNA double-strand break repair helicase HerA [Metallosphaera javensis (ex Sakai et al. 2022)]